MEGQLIRERDSEQRRQEAWQVHQVLMLVEASTPSLRTNPFWTMLKQDAYERFAIELTRQA